MNSVLRAGRREAAGRHNAFYSVSRVTLRGTRIAIIRSHAGLKGSAVMDDLLEMGERVLTVDIPDEVLERAANAEGQAVTWVHCTHAWQYCEWPQVGGSTAS